MGFDITMAIPRLQQKRENESGPPVWAPMNGMSHMKIQPLSYRSAEVRELAYRRSEIPREA